MSVNTLVLKGRKVVGGVVEGEALVTKQTISGWGGINPMSGTITELGTNCAASASRTKSWCSPAPRARPVGRRCFT
jgi:predicted aconitase with swiveling domain